MLKERTNVRWCFGGCQTSLKAPFFLSGFRAEMLRHRTLHCSAVRVWTSLKMNGARDEVIWKNTRKTESRTSYLDIVCHDPMPCCSIAFLSCNKNTWSNEHVIDSSISNSSNSLESTFWSSALIQAPFDRGLAGPFFLGCKRQNKKHRSKLKAKHTCAQKVTFSFARGQGSHTFLVAGGIEEKDVFLSPMPPMLATTPWYLLRCDKCECDEWKSKVKTKTKQRKSKTDVHSFFWVKALGSDSI